MTETSRTLAWGATLGALVAAACGGAAARPGTAEPGRDDAAALDAALDRLVAAAARGDHAAIAGMLAPAVGYGGLWFDDPGCGDALATAGMVAPAGRDVLARCVAALPLARSARASATPGTGVLAYAPGIELEVAFDLDDRGATLTWIGYAGRRGAGDALPTITGDALEALRPGGPRPATEADAAAWLKICLDASGAVAGVHPRAGSSPEALAAAVTVARAWTFRPFELGGEPAPVCAMVAIAHPGGDDVASPTLPVGVPDRHRDAVVVPSTRIAGTRDPIPGDRDRDAIRRRGDGRIESDILVCFDPAGHHAATMMLRSTGYPDYDRRIAATLATWRAPPLELDGRPVATCSRLRFAYVPRS